MPHPTTPNPDPTKTRRDDVRFRLLNALAEDPSLSQRDLASAAGVSLGAANARINGLIEAGLVEIANAETAAGRFRMSYKVTRTGKATKTRLEPGYLARRLAEHEALGREIAGLKKKT